MSAERSFDVIDNATGHDRASWDGEGFPDRLTRAKGRLTPAAFAQKCGISETVLRKYLSGVSVPGADKLTEIARVAGVSLTWLATGEGAPDGVDNVLDTDLLRTVMAGVEEGLAAIQGRMPLEKKAELIAMLYEMERQGESMPKEPLRKLIRLVSG
ncbi:helix-turn-helix transcriptional regulator [Thiohalocapsa marina]|uniref:Helix-turn-helix transcriptional regulator n=1 Tax=Thiohalocapsa marina TaxID=424902 RepID=A0A5M8FHM9_9GAMM|nr:helix-turn-helix transcriptional regulator [Thiohalocapsa marina]KAA6184237.1 helix-turn-helix transcriptional regulator [Thiohalocapsa marina]